MKRSSRRIGYVLIFFFLTSCDKKIAKTLEGLYSGTYTEEKIEVGIGYSDTEYFEVYEILEDDKNVILNNDWVIPVDGIRNEKIYETGTNYHKTIQFKGDSLLYSYSIVVDGNSGYYTFKGSKN